jgi:hypothetical protein
MVAIGAATAMLAAPAEAVAGWGSPVALIGPQQRDIVPAQIAFSGAGEAAVAFGEQDPENTADANAFVAERSPSGHFGQAQRLPGVQSALGLAFGGSTLQVETGWAPSPRSCCAAAAIATGPRLASGPSLVGGLTGITDGQLTALTSGKLLASIATSRGVWVAQSGGGGRFGLNSQARRLRFTGAATDLAAAPLRTGGGSVAWAAADGNGVEWPRQIWVAFGSAAHAPEGPRAVVAVPSGHSVDEVALAEGVKGPALAWVESWYDSHGGYYSVVKVRDLGRPNAATATVSSAFSLAAGLAFASNAAGGQVLSFESCGTTGSCVVLAAVREARQHFAAPQQVGSVDPSEAPAPSISSGGEAVVGWISGGRVLASATGPRGGSFGRPVTVSPATDGADLTLSFGPGRQALAAWTEGSSTPVLQAAAYSG